MPSRNRIETKISKKKCERERNEQKKKNNQQTRRENYRNKTIRAGASKNWNESQTI